MNWSEVRQLEPIRLNLGGGADCHPQPHYEHFVSVDFAPTAAWSVQHDLAHPIPLPDGSVERILTEHCLEHLEADKTAKVFADCHRLLVPGGLLRLAVPDYGSPRNRAFRARGFDPNHTDHKIFPTYPLMRELVSASPFGTARFYQYWDGERFVNGAIDYSLGWVKRTADHDRRKRCDGFGRLAVRTLRDAGFVISRGFRASRNELLTQRYHPLRMTSIVIDLYKTG